MESTTIGNVEIIVAMPHPVRFQDWRGQIITVAPCGYGLKADAIETFAGEKNGATLVKTQFVPSPEGQAELEQLQKAFPNAIIVGSIVSAQAFPGVVHGLVPVPGTERNAPAEKLFLTDKFTTF